MQTNEKSTGSTTPTQSRQLIVRLAKAATTSDTKFNGTCHLQLHFPRSADRLRWEIRLNRRPTACLVSFQCVSWIKFVKELRTQMPLIVSWREVALRLALAAIFSFLIGFNRDERGHPAGIRTTMLVCLAATFAQL